MALPLQVYVVIAGDFRQSEDARRAKGVSQKQWLYMGIRGILRGHLIDEDDIVCVGEWWNRSDLSVIMAEIKSALDVSASVRGRKTQ